MKSCVVMGPPRCQMTDDRCQRLDFRVQRTEFSVLSPLSSVLYLEIRARLDEAGAATALEQGALACGPRSITRHADVVWRVGGAGREGPNCRCDAREVEFEGAGRNGDGRRR